MKTNWIFREKNKFKVGDMFYPSELGIGFLEKDYWCVIDKMIKGRVINIKFFTCIDCAELYSDILKGRFRIK